MSRGRRNTSRQETKENYSEFVDLNIFQSTLRSAGGGDERLWSESPEKTRKRGLLRIIGSTVVGALVLTWGANVYEDITNGLECYGEQTVSLGPGVTLSKIADDYVNGEAYNGAVTGYIAKINDIPNPNEIPSFGELEVPEYCEKF